MAQVPSPNGNRKLVFPSGWFASHTPPYRPGARRVHADPGYTFFAVAGNRQYPIRVDSYVQPHVVWANDSSGALFFFSDGGANGGYHTKLISFDGDRVNVTDPTRQVADDFISYRDKLGIKCDPPHEYPNLYGLGWFDASHGLVVAETVGHSICDCFSAFRAYEVELPSGKIVRSFDQAIAKKMFDGNLWDLSDAPYDDWDSNPAACALKVIAPQAPR